MILQLNINRTNLKLVTTNPVTYYIIGIGPTDYTIHKKADTIKQMYTGKYNFIGDDSTIKDFHNYHVCTWAIRCIVSDMKVRDSIKYKGITYKVKNCSIGIPNLIKCYIPRLGRGYQSMEFEGTNIKEIDQK